MGTGWRRAFCTTIPTGERRDSNASTSSKERLHHHQQNSQSSPSPSPRSCAKLGLFSSISTPTTPKLQCSSSGKSNSSTPSLQSETPNLHCRTTTSTAGSVQGVGRQCQSANNTPRLQCSTSNKSTYKSKSFKTRMSPNPSSPRSPFSILKSTLRLSRHGCGVCLQSVKTGQGMAIYTAECSHTFHFPCIAAHIRKLGSLICPVCNVTWKDVPLLSVHKNNDASNHKINPHYSTTSSSTPERDNDVVVEKTITSVSSQSTPKAAGTNRIQVDEKRIQSSISAVKIKRYEQAYNDDEPLLSPTGRARFNPIPETDERGDDVEDDEDVQEFQGFFINPTPSTPTTPKTPKKDAFIIDSKVQRNVEVKLLPETAVVSLGRTHETYAVVLRIKAPPPPPPSSRQSTSAAPLLSPSHRAPIDLVTVLDVSGSMTGAKLQMLKRAMRLVISSLGPADRLSIVAFAATPQRLLSLKRMTPNGQQLARRIIDQLGCGQGTSVKEALRKATKVLEDRREKNPVASIMLLSDGQEENDRTHSNSMNQRQSGSHASSTRFAHIEIPVHSFGYGGERAGGYGHEPTENAFAKCVGGLLSVVVQDLRIQLGFASGSGPAEIMAVYSCNGRPTLLNSDSISLGDLYAEEERELLIELKVPTSSIGSHHIMSVRCSYQDPPTQELMYGKERALLVPRPHAVRSTDPRIERLRNVFIATRAVAESRRLVEHSDFTSAHHLLSSARALLMQSNLASADEHVKGLEAELSEVHMRRQYQLQLQQQQEVMMIVQQQRRRGSEKEMAFLDENGEPLTPTSAWRAAERLAKLAMTKKSMKRDGDLHGFENARF